MRVYIKRFTKVVLEVAWKFFTVKFIPKHTNFKLIDIFYLKQV